MYFQKRVKGGRRALPSAVIDKIWKEVDRHAKKYNCSWSFVIATALAYVFKISEQEDYHDIKRKKVNKNGHIRNSNK